MLVTTVHVTTTSLVISNCVGSEEGACSFGAGLLNRTRIAQSYLYRGKSLTCLKMWYRIMPEKAANAIPTDRFTAIAWFPPTSKTWQVPIDNRPSFTMKSISSASNTTVCTPAHSAIVEPAGPVVHELHIYVPVS